MVKWVAGQVRQVFISFLVALIDVGSPLLIYLWPAKVGKLNEMKLTLWKHGMKSGRGHQRNSSFDTKTCSRAGWSLQWMFGFPSALQPDIEGQHSSTFLLMRCESASPAAGSPRQLLFSLKSLPALSYCWASISLVSFHLDLGMSSIWTLSWLVRRLALSDRSF